MPGIAGHSCFWRAAGRGKLTALPVATARAAEADETAEGADRVFRKAVGKPKGKRD
jgi:hypothetical protein